MHQYLKDLLIKHKFSGVLLDTNLLLLYFIGLFEPAFVPQFKRTSIDKIIVTPQILAETWNFLEKIKAPKLNKFITFIIPKLHLIDEAYTNKNRLITVNGFEYIGIADASIICAAKKRGCLVLTDDLRAYHHFLSNEVTAININHLRQT